MLRSSSVAGLVIVLTTLVSAPLARAQQDVAAQPAADPATQPAVEPAAEPTPEPVAEPASEPVAPDPVPEPPAPGPEPEAEAHWYDDLSIRVFADAYFAGHWTLPFPISRDHSLEIGHRAFDVNGGFNVSFAGIDLTYAADPIGATVGLRFGSSVARYIGPTSGLPDGTQFLKQAFVSWRPVDMLQLDFGEFDTIYGAEVSESWLNPTYTRGSLYQLTQPLYHTGLRAVVTPTDWLTLNAIVVNGWNNILDNNDGKTFGLQAKVVFGVLTALVGYLGGPEQADDPMMPGNEDKRWRHLLDGIVSLDLGDFDLVVNADYLNEDVGGGDANVTWGAMLGARYQLIPEFALAARLEYVGDPDEPADGARHLYTTTLTFDVQPVTNLVIRLDVRTDFANNDRFPDPDGGATSTAFSTVLGIVVHN